MEPEFSGFKRLVAWQKAFGLACEVHKATASFPGSERFGLTSQLNRAALSVPSNVAEGYGRGQYTRDFVRFLAIARGSLCEVETCLLLARELGFLEPAAFGRLEAMAIETSRLITGLIRSVEQKTGVSEDSEGYGV